MMRAVSDYCEFDYDLFSRIQHRLGDEILYFIAIGGRGIPTLFVREGLTVKHCTDEAALRNELGESNVLLNPVISVLVTPKLDLIQSFGHGKRCLDDFPPECILHGVSKTGARPLK